MAKEKQFNPCPRCSGREIKILSGPILPPNIWARCDSCKIGTTYYPDKKGATKAWNSLDIQGLKIQNRSRIRERLTEQSEQEAMLMAKKGGGVWLK